MILITHLIATYGYAAVGIGTFIEGETILVLAGFAAHQGYLDLHWVIFWAIVGSFGGDQLSFYLGRAKGETWLEKRPKWQPQAKRIFSLLHKHQNLLIFGFRFVYGFRTITPIILGTARISPVRFSLLNLLSASLWAVAVTTLGYLFGNIAEALLGNLKNYEFGLFVTVAVAGMLFWLRHVVKAHRSMKKK
ncbi:DedA family protein [Desulforhopalus vacuolatus]|uniref:DedA family protein n=1 Tax=Desulforhopalus vacuolatus TaxID=40414 RepID=UPI0019647E53|nr:DedA family protein [Desulforhopalus vacuolatus]MBM9520768.1 DedA family protein [Desulforhopalus vacuolatus]